MVNIGSSTKLFAGVELAVPRLGNVRLRLHFLRRGTSGGRYATLDNNPIWKNDVNGDKAIDPHLEVEQQANGTYKVVGGEVNSDKNIYEVKDGKRTNIIIGQMLTENTFFTDDNKPVVGAIINPDDNSGNKFFQNEIIKEDPQILLYMSKAHGRQPLDFKSRGFEYQKRFTWTEFVYRGMPYVDIESPLTNSISIRIFASARDFGNIGAGYIAGINGLAWQTARVGFDGLESIQQLSISSEGPTTQKAEFIGFNIGSRKRNTALWILRRELQKVKEESSKRVPYINGK